MKPKPDELIQKYLNGACSPSEEQQVENWYNAFEQAEDPYTELTLFQRKQLRERMLLKIETGIRADKPRFNFKRIIYITATAATLLLVVNYRFFFGTTGSVVSMQSPNNQQVVIDNHSNAILKQVLPDQSIVWLSPGASIQYETTFVNHRVIHLTGESFFEVTKDKLHPFIVHSRHVTTKVWGTSFRVRDLSDAKAAEVAVLTGKVSVKLASGSGKEVMLLPRQLASYHSSSPLLKVEEVGRSTALEIWKKTDLVFDKASLADVIQKLNKEFDVNISLNDESISHLEMQADFNGQSLPDIMLILCKLTGCTYTTDGRKFTLQK